MSVEFLTSEELDQAVANTVRSTGYTLDELFAQAERGEFGSEQARLAFGIVRDVMRIRIEEGRLMPMKLGRWGDELLTVEVAEGMDEWCLNFWDEDDGLFGSTWYCRLPANTAKG